MSKRGEGLNALYIKFLKVYLRAHNEERCEEAHKKAQDLWHELKVGKKVDENSSGPHFLMGGQAKATSQDAQKQKVWAGFF